MSLHSSVLQEALETVFGRRVLSPYMSMAPEVLPEVRAQFPALAHVDGTARHQSVGVHDEPWLHALLLAVGRETGLAGRAPCALPAETLVRGAVLCAAPVPFRVSAG